MTKERYEDNNDIMIMMRKVNFRNFIDFDDNLILSHNLIDDSYLKLQTVSQLCKYFCLKSSIINIHIRHCR